MQSNSTMYLKNVQTQELQHHVKGAKQELADLLDLYLNQDIAGDNQDRRNKIEAAKFIKELLKDYGKILKNTTENTVQTKFLQQNFVSFMFSHRKYTFLKTLKDVEGLYELFLNTENASNIALRKRMAESVNVIKEFKSLIKRCAPNEITAKTLKFVCHE